MALPNTIEIKFKASGEKELKRVLSELDRVTKGLTNAQMMMSKSSKKASTTTKQLTLAQKKAKLGLLGTAHSSRILGGSLAVLRSKILIASFAMAMFGATIGKLVKAQSEQEKAEKKLAQALKSTGHSAGVTHKQLLLMASGLQAVTTHGDEAIIEAQSLMLTFTNINKDVFPQALESILNVSEAMGQDLKQSTIQIGKALNDPIQGMSALRRIGIQLSDTQKNQVKSFMAINDVASAQKVIIKELDTQFGGMARAVRLTLAGSLIALSNSFGDMMEKMGEKLAPFITALAGSLESITTIMQSEGERQLAFLTKIGASEDTIRLARIRLLKEEAQERLNAIGATDIDLNRTDKLNESYLEQQAILVKMRDDLVAKEKALSGSTSALMGAVETSEGFNQAISDGESALNDFGKSLTTGGFSLGANMGALAGVNVEMGKKVVLDKEAVEAQRVLIAKQIESNEALGDYMRALGFLPGLTAGVKKEILAQIKVMDVAKSAMTSFGEALVPDANVGEAFKKFIINYLNLIQGVIIASGEMSKAIAWAFTPMGMVKSVLALIALEVAKAGVRNVKFAEHGFEGFVDKPTLFMTGEGNKREHVSITPLESPNINGATGAGITVNIMGGIVQEDYVTNQIIPAINKALGTGQARLG